jgi:hypothetical protein
MYLQKIEDIFWKNVIFFPLWNNFKSDLFYSFKTVLFSNTQEFQGHIKRDTASSQGA